MLCFIQHFDWVPCTRSCWALLVSVDPSDVYDYSLWSYTDLFLTHECTPCDPPAEVTHILYVVAANPPVTSSLFSSTSQRAHREVDVVISALKSSYSPVRRCWRRCRNAWARGWSWSFCCWEQNNSRQSVIREWVDCCLDQVVKVKRGVGESNMMGRATCNRWEV